MIARVHRRGSRVGGLLRYLYGPGRHEEHVNPRIVAAWDGAGPLADLEPTVTAAGKRDFRHLVALLEEPVRGGIRPPKKPVWHCSMRLAPEDRYRTFSDDTWGHMARAMLVEAGLATEATDPGLRWIVVRHADDHVHIVATLVREDGRTNWMRNDYPKCVAATYNVARRFNLRRRVPPADRTAHRRPHPAEVGKSRRTGRTTTPRDELRRRVRLAAAGATGDADFFDRLREAGVLLRLRHSSRQPDQVTGYAVALPDARAANGQPVYFSGGRLAPDLTLPKLRQRWQAGPTTVTASPMSRRARIDALSEAATAVRAAAEEIRTTGRDDPHRAQAAALAAADVLTCLAHAVEGGRRGPLHRAAEVLDRAARGLYGRVARATSRSQHLRAMARLVTLMGRISGDEETVAVLVLVMDLARLGDALEQLRAAQHRMHQAEAARAAAAMLRTTADGGRRLVTPPRATTSRPASAEDRRATRRRR